MQGDRGLNEQEITGIGFTSQRTRDRLVERLAEAGIRHPRVLELIGSTPRHLFVDEALAHRAYEDSALPIGHRQTISQPFVVARMTEALMDAGVRGRVLEIGTGCGYQAALLAQLVDAVYSVERVQPLLQRSRETLRRLGLRNVHLRHADGTEGWPERAPFDGILLTAAPRELPAAIADQLADGGVLIAPVGSGRVQELRRVVRNGEQLVSEVLDHVRFVPLCGGTVH